MILLKKAIKKIIGSNRLLNDFALSLWKRPLTEFFDVGFHGDKHLIDVIFPRLASAEVFIETGTSTGSSMKYVAINFPNIRAYGCEPDRTAFDFAKSQLSECKNVELKKQLSPGFLYDLVGQNQSLTKKDVVFWLDSHANGFTWPLRDEVRFITANFEKGYIFIDDFLVPGQPQFGYDQYGDQICSLDYIKDTLDPQKKYVITYPAYKDKTSDFCKLRGWCMIEFGHPGMNIQSSDLINTTTI